MRRSHTGNALLATAAVLSVVAVLASLGAWNYFRNLRSEQQEFRPYRGVSNTELSQLADAYRSESERADSRYGAAQSRSGQVRDRQHLGERLDEFERVRRRSEHTRSLGAKAAELETSLRSVEQEIQLREGERDRVALFLRRLLAI